MNKELVEVPYTYFISYDILLKDIKLYYQEIINLDYELTHNLELVDLIADLSKKHKVDFSAIRINSLNRI